MSAFGRKTVLNSLPAERRELAASQGESMPNAVVGLAAAKAASSTAKDFIRDQVFTRVEPLVAVRTSKEELVAFVNKLVAELANDRKILLNQDEQHILSAGIVDEMVGLGPIEPLLRDPSVNDILVNGSRQIYVERHGKLELSKLQFRTTPRCCTSRNASLRQSDVASTKSSPMLDARLADGSRVNVIIPPLSLKGPCISIRKFSKTHDGILAVCDRWGPCPPELGARSCKSPRAAV